MSLMPLSLVFLFIVYSEIMEFYRRKRIGEPPKSQAKEIANNSISFDKATNEGSK